MPIIISILVLVVSYIFRRLYRRIQTERHEPEFLETYTGPIAFFHPFCNDCGGGERVLWFMISHIQNRFPLISIKIYTCDSTDPAQILKRAHDRFNILIKNENIEFLFLPGKKLIIPSSWPRFTLFGQTFGSVILGIQALMYPIPDVLIDTTGFVFFGVVLKIFGCRRYGTYIHFPTISTDMISHVSHRSASYNNNSQISKNIILTSIKLVYYKIFAFWYRFGGAFIDYCACNSHWTHAHIKNLWKKDDSEAVITYPPCSPHFFKSSLDKENVILSVSQFRPEKDHKKQIDIASEVLHKFSKLKSFRDIKFVFIGSTRSKEDTDYLESLIEYSKLKKVDKFVEFKVNLSFNELSDFMSKSLIGLHTMNQEHFGIGIVEMMASGLIMIAHGSGGPESDIVVDYKGNRVGFLARTVEEYSDSIINILGLRDSEIEEIRKNSIKSVNERFSDENFNANITKFIEKIVL